MGSESQVIHAAWKRARLEEALLLPWPPYPQRSQLPNVFEILQTSMLACLHASICNPTLHTIQVQYPLVSSLRPDAQLRRASVRASMHGLILLRWPWDASRHHVCHSAQLARFCRGSCTARAGLAWLPQLSKK